MPSAPKKTGTTILDSHNDCIGALKGNQSGLLAAVFANFQPQATTQQINKGHGRIEKRTVSISHLLEGIPDFPGLSCVASRLPMVLERERGSRGEGERM